MVEKKRMPQLTIDEVLLLVDTYFQIQEIDDTELKKELIQDLSDSLRALPFFPELRQNLAFRSVAGMNMCLANVAYIDPKKTTKFGHGSKLQRRVFDYYVDNRSFLHAITATIKSIGSFDFPILPDYRESIMGQLIPSYHEYLEQNDKSVKNARKMMMLRNRSECAVCRVDLAEKYSAYSMNLLEAHIALPVTQLNGKQMIASSDILFLCPTCHKMAHMSPMTFEEQALREMIKG